LANFAGAFERGDDLSAFMSGASIVKQYMQSQASTALDALRAIGKQLAGSRDAAQNAPPNGMTPPNCKKSLPKTPPSPKAPMLKANWPITSMQKTCFKSSTSA
jgi:hypothetical protein